MKEKGTYELLKELTRKELIRIGMWLPRQKSKPSGKRYKRSKFNKKDL